MTLKRTLGKSGIEVSALGMGCWAIGGPWTWAQPGNDPFPAGWGKIDDQESIRAIQASLDGGINFFDTAANYGAGHSEVVLGKALRGKRDQAVIATKFGHIIDEQARTVYGDPDQILQNVRIDVENSLRRLQMETIDIFQLHDGGFDLEPALALREVLEVLVKQGKIRWYGWSTDLVDRAKVFALGAHCTSIQFRLNAIFDNLEMRQLCAQYDLAGINKDPLNKGILTGKFKPDSKFPQDDNRTGVDFSQGEYARRLKLVEDLREILTSDGRSMAQGALAYIWALDKRMVPIPGFKTLQQVTDNAGALGHGALSQSQLDQVQSIVASYSQDTPGQ